MNNEIYKTLKILIYALLVITIVALAASIIFGSFGWGGYPYYHYGMMGWYMPGMFFGFFFVVLFFIFILWFLNAIPERENYNHAREIIEIRYAKGEITRDEYLKMMKDLDEKYGR